MHGKRKVSKTIISLLDQWAHYELVVRLGSFNYEGLPKGKGSEMTQPEKDADTNKWLDDRVTGINQLYNEYKNLPDKQCYKYKAATALYLHYVDGHTVAYIAKLGTCEPKTIYRRLEFMYDEIDILLDNLKANADPGSNHDKHYVDAKLAELLSLDV